MRACVAIVPLALIFATAANAQTVNRAWVSGKGTDAPGCGAPTNPCRSFQYTHDHIVAAGGEIDVLDGAGYGAVDITKALSIVAVGVVAAVQQPTTGGTAITINAGASDSVHLRGLTVDGLGAAAFGIRVENAKRTWIEDCYVRYFSGAGIDMEVFTALSQLSVDRTHVTDNATGIQLFPSASAGIAISNVTANNNSANGVQIGGGAATVNVSVVNSAASGNGNDGIFAVAVNAATVLHVSLRNVFVTNNREGVATLAFAGGTAQVTLGDSLVAGNSIGADGASGGTIYSFVDNRFDDNAEDFASGFALTLINRK